MRLAHLAHLAHTTSIANLEATSIWHCVLICVMQHRAPWSYHDMVPYALCALAAFGALFQPPEHFWFSAAASGRPLIIHRSILITSDSGGFYPDVPSVSSSSELRLSWYLTSGSYDPEHSAFGLRSFWRLTLGSYHPELSCPDTFAPRSIILIPPAPPAVPWS